MKEGLKIDALIYIAETYEPCGTATKEQVLRDIEFGANWQSEQSNQVIQELVQAL